MMLGPMMQALLEDRFKLKLHRQTAEIPVYDLTVARRGLKIEAAKDERCKPPGLDVVRMISRGAHTCGVFMPSANPEVPAALDGATMADLGRALSSLLGRDVVDKTGVSGVFDFRLEISRCDQFPVSCIAQDGGSDALPSAPTPRGVSIFQSLHKLGLQLEAAKASAEVIVIDQVEKPSEN
jgi:uncharacterized protein (TIGR03435 family)